MRSFNWTRRISRKQLGSSDSSGSNSPVAPPRLQQPSVARGLGGEAPMACDAGRGILEYSRAGHQAHNPFGNFMIVKVARDHVFACMISARPSAKGASYLHRNLYDELVAQAAKQPSIPAAFEATVRELDAAFSQIHASNGPVLAGLDIAATYVHYASNSIYIASNGGTRAVVGRRVHEEVTVAAEAGGAAQHLTSADSFSAEHVEVVPLHCSIRGVILGSTGLWHEVGAHTALLRTRHFFADCPAANKGSAAAHLTNYALHAISKRLRASHDPRMASLNDASRLESLWVGDRSQFKYGRRQPVRRRRGDVHGDISAIVLRFNWAEQPEHTECKLRKSTSMPQVSRAQLQLSAQRVTSQRPTAQAHWRLLRMHFLTFPADWREAKRQRWLQLIADVKAARSGQHPKAGELSVSVAADGRQSIVPCSA